MVVVYTLRTPRIYVVVMRSLRLYSAHTALNVMIALGALGLVWALVLWSEYHVPL